MNIQSVSNFLQFTLSTSAKNAFSFRFFIRKQPLLLVINDKQRGLWTMRNLLRGPLKWYTTNPSRNMNRLPDLNLKTIAYKNVPSSLIVRKAARWSI